ncbi:MAG: hypothetical protein J7L88_04440 [Thermoplasmata archaeon]|nr:hypothetical protein [Thermoplasmata archaeon]
MVLSGLGIEEFAVTEVEEMKFTGHVFISQDNAGSMGKWKYNYDLQNTGLYPYPLHCDQTDISSRLKWTVQLESLVYAQPIVDDIDGDGRYEILTGTGSFVEGGYLYCLGEEKKGSPI